MLLSDSLFVVLFMSAGTRVTIAASRHWQGYEVHLPRDGRYTVRAGDSPVMLHNSSAPECPPGQDTKVNFVRSPDIGRVGHTFVAF